jgi:hypothetical protein
MRGQLVGVQDHCCTKTTVLAPNDLATFATSESSLNTKAVHAPGLQVVTDMSTEAFLMPAVKKQTYSRNCAPSTLSVVARYFEVSYIARYREKLIRVLLIFGEFQPATNKLLRRAESASRSRLLDRVLARRSLDH